MSVGRKKLSVCQNYVAAFSCCGRSFSFLRRVKTHLRGKMGQERLSSLCRIAIHKDILKEMEDMNILHSLVIDKFVQNPRRLNFHFK